MSFNKITASNVYCFGRTERRLKIHDVLAYTKSSLERQSVKSYVLALCQYTGCKYIQESILVIYGSGSDLGCRRPLLLGRCLSSNSSMQLEHTGNVVAIAFYLIIKTSLHPWNNYLQASASRHVASDLMRCSVNKAFRIPQISRRQVLFSLAYSVQCKINVLCLSCVSFQLYNVLLLATRLAELAVKQCDQLKRLLEQLLTEVVVFDPLRNRPIFPENISSSCIQFQRKIRRNSCNRFSCFSLGKHCLANSSGSDRKRKQLHKTQCYSPVIGWQTK